MGSGLRMNGAPRLPPAPEVFDGHTPARVPLIDVGPILLQILQIVSAPLDPVPKRQIVSPGLDVAWDSCCDGQSWVRLQAIEPLGPAKLPGPPCERTWRLYLGIGVLRCVAAMDERGRAPSPERTTADALQGITDQSTLCSAIQCDLMELGTIDTLRWDALGPEGGCAGGEWLVTMKATTFDCGTGPNPGSGHPGH